MAIDNLFGRKHLRCDRGAFGGNWYDTCEGDFRTSSYRVPSVDVMTRLHLSYFLIALIFLAPLIASHMAMAAAPTGLRFTGTKVERNSISSRPKREDESASSQAATFQALRAFLCFVADSNESIVSPMTTHSVCNMLTVVGSQSHCSLGVRLQV